MRRIATVLVAVVVIGVLRVPDVLAGGGNFLPPPDKTVGPTVNVSVVMEGPRQPLSEPNSRQFAVSVRRSHQSWAAMFTGNLNYLYGCQQPGFPDLQASTEQRFLGFMNAWAPPEVLDALFGAVGDPDRAAIIAIDTVSCTPIGAEREYLFFTGRIKFAK